MRLLDLIHGSQGGILGCASGFSDGNIKIQNCCNLVNIHSGGNSGGLVGYSYNSHLHIYNSYNEGTIDGISSGGLVGDSRYAALCINCFNKGDITGSSNSGGLMGYFNDGGGFNKSVFNNCFNTGNIYGNEETKKGGILGDSWKDITLSVNNVYYLNNTEKIYNFLLKYNQVVTLEASKKEYLQSEELTDELNTYVNNYNEEHKSDEDFVELRNWKYNQGNYPTFE